MDLNNVIIAIVIVLLVLSFRWLLRKCCDNLQGRLGQQNRQIWPLLKTMISFKVTFNECSFIQNLKQLENRSNSKLISDSDTTQQKRRGHFRLRVPMRKGTAIHF